MMPNQRDEMLVAAALGAAAFGYWYSKRQTSTDSGQSSDTSGIDDTSSTDTGTGIPLVQGFDTSSNNIMTPSQVFQSGVGTTTVRGSVTNTQSQTFPLGTNG